MKGKARTRLLLMGACLAFSSIFQMGYANAYPNTAIDGFRQFLNQSFAEQGSPLTEQQFTWTWSSILNVYFIGFAIGSWIAVPFADRVGRKWCLVIGNTCNFLSAVMATISIIVHMPFLFFISRIFFALSAAISMNSLILLLQESSPPDMRGIMSFNAEMAFVVTNLVGVVAGMKIVLGQYITWIIGLSCIPTFLSILIALWFHESPKYLMLTKKDKESAEKSIQFYLSTDLAATREHLHSIEAEGLDEYSDSRGSMSRTTLFGLLLGIITLQITASIWPILFFSTEFLIRADIDPETSEFISTLMLLLSTVSTVIGMFIVEKFPRRTLLLGAASINVLALILFFISEQGRLYIPSMKYGCILAVIFHGTSYSMALGPIAWFLTAELVPLNHRALCQSIALSTNQLTALVLSIITLPLYASMGSWILLILFAIPGAICIAVLTRYLPETREKNIDEIVKLMVKRAKCLERKNEHDIPMNCIPE